MIEEADEPRREVTEAKEHLHHDIEELERLRETERRLEHRIEADLAEIEKLTHEDREHEIVVNGEKKTVNERKVTFEEVVALAYPHANHGPNVSYSVTYRLAADHECPEGTLVAGGSVRIKNGTRFNVRATDKS